MLQELTMNNAIFVTKRDNTKEEVSFDKVLKRMKILSYELTVNPHLIAQKLCNRIYDGVKTSELDILGAEICANMITIHPIMILLEFQCQILRKTLLLVFQKLFNII